MCVFYIGMCLATMIEENSLTPLFYFFVSPFLSQKEVSMFLFSAEVIFKHPLHILQSRLSCQIVKKEAGSVLCSNALNIILFMFMWHWTYG